MPIQFYVYSHFHAPTAEFSIQTQAIWPTKPHILSIYTFISSLLVPVCVSMHTGTQI